MGCSFNEFRENLLRLRNAERDDMPFYEEYRKNEASKNKYDYASSVTVPDSMLCGRTIFSLSHNRFSPPSYHTHSFFELIYVMKGKFINTVEGHDIIMKAGDFCLIPPRVYHSFDVIDSDFEKRLEAFALNVFIRESSAEAYFSGYGNDALNRFFAAVKSKSNHRKFALFSPIGYRIADELITLLDYAVSESTCDSGGNYDERLSGSIMRTLAAEMLGSSYKISFSQSFTSNSSTSDIIKFISDNFATVTLENVADAFNYSFSYTSKLIKQRTGLGFSELVSSIRIKRACEMLETTDKTAKEICALCGYGSIEHFHRAFRKEKGCTPNKYREQFKTKNQYE